MVDTSTAQPLAEGVEVQLVNDLADTVASVVVDADLAALFAYSRKWSAAVKNEAIDLSFSSMLAAMVADEQPLCRWLAGFFDRLGVNRDDITKGLRFTRSQLPAIVSAKLVGTHSFRTAWAKAVEIRDLTSPGLPVGTRHFMAAYAVSPAYHLADFRRYRIDRREWCLELADELSIRYPAEAQGWAAYTSMAPALIPLGFDSDTPTGPDLMHLKREVESIARLVASRSTTTPLSIAVFGAWGSGKSFFLDRLRDGIAKLAREANELGPESPFHQRIAQVEFNAWHYSEDALVASLVAHIFRNLRFDELDEDDQEMARRAAALMLQIQEKDEALAGAGARYVAIKASYAKAEAELARVEQSLPASLVAARRELTAARASETRAATELERVRQRRDEAIETARRGAAGGALLAAVVDDSTASTFGSAAQELVGLTSDLRSLRTRWRSIALGAVVLAGTAAFGLLAGTELWAGLLSAVTAIGSLAALARIWVAKLDRIAEVGSDLTDAATEAANAAMAHVEQQYRNEIEALEQSLSSSRAAREAAEQKLRSLSTLDAAGELEARKQELAAAMAGVAKAQSELDAARTTLDQLSVDELLREFLDDRRATDTYESQLGLLSQVRNDFERLSRLMERANADHVAHGRPAPTVSRIVLYIDDLDRCPEGRVVEVIRAVHLLLAFPLFVCVVAADPRWLTRCLENAPGVHSSINVDDDVLASQFGRPADPADYIEKIFQVPIWLRPIPTDRRAGLLRSWLDESEGRDATATGGISSEELEFLSFLAERLDGKPRTLKRLANTYRLVKAGLSDVAYSTFLSDGLAPSDDGRRHRPYRTCLTLLTVLNGNRDEAIRMVQLLDASKATSIEEWLGELALENPELARFLEAAFGQANLTDLTELKSWLDHTRRYSFYL